MATTHRQVRKAAEANILSQSGDMHHCGNFLTLEDRQALASKPECTSCRTTQCAPFILPWNGDFSNSVDRRGLRPIRILIEAAFYVIVGGIAIYSVVMNSLPALMSAVIAAGLYIVVSHFYQRAAGTREEVENRNYLSLISPGMSRN